MVLVKPSTLFLFKLHDLKPPDPSSPMTLPEMHPRVWGVCVPIPALLSVLGAPCLGLVCSDTVVFLKSSWVLTLDKG